MYGNLDSQAYQQEVESNKLVSSLVPGIYKNATLSDISYSNESIEKIVFTFKGEGFSGTVDVLAAKTDEDGEKLTRAFAHILTAFGVDIQSVLGQSINSFESLANLLIKALKGNTTLVDVKITGYTYSNGSKYGQGFPVSGKSTKTGGWIPNNFIVASPGNLSFSDYENKKIAEYNNLKSGVPATTVDLDAVQSATADLFANNNDLPFN